MTQRERIAWYLRLQELSKISKNRIAPATVTLKKRMKSLGETNSASALFIPRPPVPFVSRSKMLTPQAGTLYHRDKALAHRSNSNRTIAGSPISLLPGRHPRESPANLHVITKQDDRFIVMHSHGRYQKRSQVLPGQPASSQRLSAATTMELTNFTNQSYAPAGTYSPPSQHVNDDPLELPPFTTGNNTEMMPHRRNLQAIGSNFDRSSAGRLSAIPPTQEKETAANLNQASSGSNAAASTLHLDGSSLGRWAIQHLERVLSKPPSGMTGVDPRATVPRSRVAPF